MLPRMVTRTRLRAVLTALGLYTVAALIIGYFGLSAYTGAHGLKAKQDLAQQQAQPDARARARHRRAQAVGAPRVAPARRQARPRPARRAGARDAQLRPSARPDPDLPSSRSRRFAALAGCRRRRKNPLQCKTLWLLVRCLARASARPQFRLCQDGNARSSGRRMAVAKTKPASNAEAAANNVRDRPTRTVRSRNSPRNRNFPPIARCC